MLNETPIAFDSEGATLRGYVLIAGDAILPRPTVIMAHGTSATIQMVAIEYARAFARAGLAALIYDHRNFGASDGEPRQVINPWVQCRGYVDALSFACTRPEVDPKRIGLWGDSYTGGQVVLVSACDTRLKAIMAQCPVFGATTPPITPSAENLAAIKATLRTGDVSGTAETSDCDWPGQLVVRGFTACWPAGGRCDEPDSKRQTQRA